MIRSTLILAASGALLGLGVWAWSLKTQNALLEAKNAALTRSIAALELERDRAKEARAVADAARARVEAQALEYGKIKESILRGEDADLPPWFHDHLVALGIVQRDPDGIR